MNQIEDQPLGFLMYRAQAVLQPAVTAALRPLGLTLPEFVCLRVLAQHSGCSNAQLARRVKVSPQAMNQVLRGLQEEGAVERPPSASTGRGLPARLTTTGKNLLARAENAARTADNLALADLTDAERRDLRKLLAQIHPSDD